MTARSIARSPFMSATATATAWMAPAPTATRCCARNRPSPLPSRIETSFDRPFATTRSGLRSPSSVAAAIDAGPLPAARRVWGSRPPAPSPSRIETSSDPGVGHREIG